MDSDIIIIGAGVVGLSIAYELTQNNYNVILIEKNEALGSAIRNNFIYICDETLAEQLEFIDELNNAENRINLVDEISAKVSIKKQ